MGYDSALPLQVGKLKIGSSVVKPVLMLLASLVLLMMVFLSGVIITAHVIAEPEPHKFANIDTPHLWTSKPKQVSSAARSYERLPSQTPPVTVAEASKDIKATDASAQTLAAPGVAVDDVVTGSVDPRAEAVGATATTPDGEPEGAPLIDPAHAQWCFARYRSYRVEDNSYQPFGGGPRRSCQAPGSPVVERAEAVPERAAADVGSDQSYMPVEETVTEDLEPLETRAARYGDPEVAERALGGGRHEEWCHARYRSYRGSDNSYQPFDGGPRRQCQSPFG